MIPACEPWCSVLNEMEPGNPSTVTEAVAEHGHWCQHSVSYVDALETSDPYPVDAGVRPAEVPAGLAVRVVSPYPYRPAPGSEHQFVGLASTDAPEDVAPMMLLTRGEALHLARLLTRAVDIADGLAPSRYQVEGR